MTLRVAALLAPLVISIRLVSVGAAEIAAPAPVTRVGDTEKVCQLTGETDWETGRPTAARTFSNFGLDAADLGYPVEHAGKLILLFGDSWPPRHPGGAIGEIPPDDAVGVTERRQAPTNDGKCLEMRVHHYPGPKKVFAPARVIGSAVKQGFFNVPSGGVSVANALYAFFWTNHCFAPNRLKPSSDDPLARPAASQGCPESDTRNSLGIGVMARSDDDGGTFNHVVAMPTGFVYSTAINTSKWQADLPENQRLGIFIFGISRYRASIPYLAYAPVKSFEDPANWQFFVGLSADGSPKWVSRDEWGGAAAPSVATPQRWRPPGEPEIFLRSENESRCIGEFSITWNRPLGMWLMLHNCPGGIEARIAPAPWGPWSSPTKILSVDEGLSCRLVMTAAGCGSRRDFWPGNHKEGKLVPGGLYAPYVLNRYTTPGDGPGRRSIIYWVVSTWNPYEVSVMRTTLEHDNR